MNRHLPLRPDVPYRRRDGSRAILEDTFAGGLRDTGTCYYFDPNTTNVFGATESPYDIVDFYTEPAIWRTRTGLEVKVTTRGPRASFDYPFCYGATTPYSRPITLTAEGYYWLGKEPSDFDLIDYVRPLATAPFDYPIRNQTKPPIYPPSQTYNPLCNMYAEMERVTDAKIKSGDYQSVPEGFKTKWGTGVHMSTQTAGLLAYFPTLRHWQRRVPQQIRAGRYLRQYFPDMHDDEIRRMSALCSTGDLRFYAKWQDMLKVYKQLADAGIVSTCMSYDKWGAMHPLMVYDNSDVELAVLYIDGSPVARALYNKHNKHFPMTYGQWEKMEQALYRAGFTHASLCGARIRKLPRYVNINRDEIDLDTVWGQARGDAILMPYIDHERALDRSHNCSTNVYLAGDHVVINYYDGEYSADNHENASLSGAQEQCGYCWAYVDEDELRYVEDRDIHVCSHCYNHNTVRVYTSRNIYFATMEDNADQDYVYLSAPDVYVRDSDAAADWGHVWSDWAEDYLDRDDAVWVDSEDDWYPDSQIGKSIMWDGEQSVYMLKEDYEALMAEREEEAEDEAQDEAA